MGELDVGGSRLVSEQPYLVFSSSRKTILLGLHMTLKI